jgi:hypothetical protein
MNLEESTKRKIDAIISDLSTKEEQKKLNSLNNKKNQKAEDDDYLDNANKQNLEKKLQNQSRYGSASDEYFFKNSHARREKNFEKN